MKKLIALLLALALIFVMSACDNNNNGSETDITSSSQPTDTSSDDASSDTSSEDTSSEDTSSEDTTSNDGSSDVTSNSSDTGSSNPQNSSTGSDNSSSKNSSTGTPSINISDYEDPNVSYKETDTSGWTMTTLGMSEGLETLSKLTTYDLLPAIKSAAALMKTATATTTTKAKFVENTNQTLSAINSLRKVTDDRIEDILTSPNTSIPDGAKVYYVSNSGNDSNDGLTPQTAWASLSKASSAKGNKRTPTYVLFERGGTWRGQISAKSYVTYSAYGTGDKPKIYASPFNGGGSENVGKWVESSKNIWTYTSSQLKDDIGALIFNDTSYASKKLSLSGVKSDLDFYHDYSKGVVYLYSTSNPASRFKSIEFNIRQHIIVAKSYVTIDNLCLKFGGWHGVRSGNAYGLTVQNCEFGWIGGSLHNPGTDDTRLGNAIEIWGYCGDFTVTDNYIYQIYDAGITQQITLNDTKQRKQENVLYSGNVLEYCNYSMEYWITSSDSNPSYIDTFLIEDNLMWYAGYGLCSTRDDKSNACHIQGWRFFDRNRATNFVIRNNVMIDSYNQIINAYTTQINADGSNSMPVLNNNIMLNKAYGQFGIIRQGTRGDESWPKTVTLDKSVFNNNDQVFNGDVIGHIAANLYKNGELSIK